MARARRRLAEDRASAVLSPFNRLPRDQQRLREMCPDLIEIVEDGDHRATVGVPVLHHAQEIRCGAGIDGGERLIEDDDAGVLQQQPGEQDTLELTSRQRPDRAPFETAEPNCHQGLAAPLGGRSADAAKGSRLAPGSQHDRIGHGQREMAVDFSRLGKIAEVPGRQAAAIDGSAR